MQLNKPTTMLGKVRLIDPVKLIKSWESKKGRIVVAHSTASSHLESRQELGPVSSLTFWRVARVVVSLPQTPR